MADQIVGSKLPALNAYGQNGSDLPSSVKVEASSDLGSLKVAPKSDEVLAGVKQGLHHGMLSDVADWQQRKLAGQNVGPHPHQGRPDNSVRMSTVPSRPVKR